MVVVLVKAQISTIFLLSCVRLCSFAYLLCSEGAEGGMDGNFVAFALLLRLRLFLSKFLTDLCLMPFYFAVTKPRMVQMVKIPIMAVLQLQVHGMPPTFIQVWVCNQK